MTDAEHASHLDLTIAGDSNCSGVPTACGKEVYRSRDEIGQFAQDQRFQKK